MQITRTTEPTVNIPQLARMVTTEIWSNGNIDLIDDVYTDDLTGGILGSYEFDGRDDYKTWVREAQSAIPDLEITINELLIGGAVVCGTWTARGTHTGKFELLGLEPTDESVEYDGMVITRIADTITTEEYHAGDYVSMLAQLGVLSR